MEQSLLDSGVEVQGLKHIIEQQTNQHIKEFSQLAASRKRSSKNINSHRSLEDMNPPTSILEPVSENVGEFGRLDAGDTERL